MSNRPSSTKAGHRSGASSSRRVSQARQAGSGSSPWTIIALGAVILVGALLLAILLVRGSDSPTTGVASAGFNLSADAPDDLVWGKVQTEGTSLVPQPEATGGTPAGDPALGQAAPKLVGQRFDGEAITIGGSGRPMVVMFVAHWCPHCQKEVPVITSHLGGKLPADVDLFAVSTGVTEGQPNFPPGKWLRRESWPVPTLVDDASSSAAQAYGLSTYPYFVAVDASGKVVARTSGELTPAQFDELLAAARG